MALWLHGFELYFVFHFFMKMKSECIKNSKKESIKRENGSQLFEFRLLY